MAINEIHVDDIGTNFNVTIKNQDDEIVDISAAIITEMLFRKPDGTVMTKTAEFISDGTDGRLRYTTVSGDLDQHGSWELQAFVDFGSTEWYSDIYKFKIYKNIGC